MSDVAPRSALSLCSGYGGLDLGIRLARPGIRLVGAVERQAYAAAVLASRMGEGALDSCPIFDDLESFDCGPYRGRVDIVIAGFPCQGASVAGKRLGTDDERWLWPEVFRIFLETEARWLFAENVPGLLSVNGGRAFEAILGDLVSRGIAAEWDCVPAGAVGAPHLRDRLFLLAADSNRVELRVEPKRHQRGRRGARATLRRNSESPHDGGTRDDPDAISIGQQARGADYDGAESRARRDIVALRGVQQSECGITDRGGSASSDATGERCDKGGQDRPGTNRRRGADTAGSGQPLERISDIVDGGRAHWDWSRAPEPTIRGVDDGSPSGMGADDPSYHDQLHLLGNGVVPHQAAVAFSILWERLHGPADDVPEGSA